MLSYVITYNIIVNTHITHNKKIAWIVQHIQTAPLFGVQILLSHIAMQ